MGTDIGDLLQKRKVGLSDLTNQVVAIDAFNTLHQFLSIIRQRDGSPLVDSAGRVTSHLSGLALPDSKPCRSRYQTSLCF